MTTLELAGVLIKMAQAVTLRDGHPGADYAHYSLKFALLAGAEECVRIAEQESVLKNEDRGELE